MRCMVLICPSSTVLSEATQRNSGRNIAMMCAIIYLKCTVYLYIHACILPLSYVFYKTKSTRKELH